MGCNKWRLLRFCWAMLAAIVIIGNGAVQAEPANPDQGSVTTRIKDIARLQGIRNNQLNGMGLVIGLNGTGDSSKANAQMIAEAISKWGVKVDVNDLKVKNIAAVVITANLPPYLHQGDMMDVSVASFGDAKSLQGGILLQAPLTGSDGKVYAVAQGAVYLGKPAAAGGTNTQTQQNVVTTVGTVPSGAIVEREIPVQIQDNNKLRWMLSSPDFTTALRLADSINKNVADGTARAVDMGTVEVTVPKELAGDPVNFIAMIESLPVSPDGLAKVIVNQRTGTVVIGDKVRLAPVAVTQRNITVKVTNQSTVSQGAGATSKATGTQADASAADNGRMIVLPEGTNIGSIVKALNKVGTDPEDIVAILVAIKNAGALYGVLEFM